MVLFRGEKHHYLLNVRVLYTIFRILKRATSKIINPVYSTLGTRSVIPHLLTSFLGLRANKTI